MSQINLKPCPFCGSKAKIKNMRCAEDAVETWVECTGCLCSTDRIEDAYSDSEAAASLWNDRRAPSTEKGRG